MKFWTSIFLAAFILMISTFILGMSALGVDLFSPQNDVDKKVGVNQLVYYFNNGDQEELQRKYIIAREIDGGSSNSKKEPKKDGISLPLMGDSSDAFEAPPPPIDALQNASSNKNGSTSEQNNDIQDKKAEEAKKAKALEEAKAAEEKAKAEAEEKAKQEQTIAINFKIKMRTNYTAQLINQNGTVIKTFFKDTLQEPGEKNLSWDRKDDNGNLVSNGNYTFKLTTESPGIPVLIYHHIALGGKGYDDNPYTETPENFLKQMDFLSENNFNVITLEELAEFMQGNKMPPPKSVVITFDDGYESVYKYAFPILKKHNFKATAFIIGKKAEGLKTSFVPNMNFAQLKEMYSSGVFDIQSHTYDLHDAVQISPKGDYGPAITSRMYLKNQDRMETQEEFIARITNDLRKGKDVLEQNIGNSVVALSWPHGKNHDKATEIAKSMGYKYFIEGSLGPNYLGDSTAAIKRVFVKKDITNDAFLRLLQPKTRPVNILTSQVIVN